MPRRRRPEPILFASFRSRDLAATPAEGVGYACSCAEAIVAELRAAGVGAELRLKRRGHRAEAWAEIAPGDVETIRMRLHVPPVVAFLLSAWAPSSPRR